MRFEKVSFVEYKKMFEGGETALTEDEAIAVRQSYDSLVFPSRATPGSAGYDFFMPFDVCYNPEAHESILVPTGFRVYMEPGEMLAVFPRSGLGVRFGMKLTNTVGIIDSDYYYADNEGHILINFTADQPFNLHAGDAFCQGIFMNYLTTTNDRPRDKLRRGGFGSTDKKKG